MTTYRMVRWVVLGSVLLLILAACAEEKEKPKSFKVGAIIENPMAVDLAWPSFKEALTVYGYTEGENITYFHATSDALLAQQVDPAELDLLVVFGGEFKGKPQDAFPQAKALAAGKIPLLVAPVSGDPVATGNAASLGQPGNNLTGIVLLDLDAKRFELMTRFLGDIQRVLIVYDTELPEALDQLPLIETIAESAGIELILLGESSSISFETLSSQAPDDVDAVFLLKIWGTGTRWFQWAFAHGIPAVQDEIFDTSMAQPMLSYGPSFEAMGTQAARIADLILQGADPGTLPFEQPDLFLSLDLGIADAIDYDIPTSLLSLANGIRRSDPALYETELFEPVGEIVHEPGTGACATTITTMAGEFGVCVNQLCADLQDGGGITYGEKADVGACTHDQLVGVCATADYDMYYYNVDPGMLRIGCGFMGGEWQPAETPSE